MLAKTKKGNWTIHGMYLVTTDAIFQKVVRAIEEDTLEQDYLQKITGNLAPIIVDKKRRTISFQSF